MVNLTLLEESKNLSYKSQERPMGIFHETVLLQSDDEERYATYRGLIREEFAKGRSVFFCLPGAEDLLNAKSTLEKGIEKYTQNHRRILARRKSSISRTQILSMIRIRISLVMHGRSSLFRGKTLGS